VRAEEVDGGHEHEPGEDAAGEHDGGDAEADDVADAEIFGGASARMAEPLRRCCGPAEVGFVVGLAGPEGEEIVVLEEGVEAPRPRPRKTRLAKLPPRSPAIRTSAQAVPSG
jgi:hypothetical protein